MGSLQEGGPIIGSPWNHPWNRNFLGVNLCHRRTIRIRWVKSRSNRTHNKILRDIYIYIPRKSKDQTLPVSSRESFTSIIPKTILCLVLDFQGMYIYIYNIYIYQNYRWWFQPFCLCSPRSLGFHDPIWRLAHMSISDGSCEGSTLTTQCWWLRPCLRRPVPLFFVLVMLFHHRDPYNQGTRTGVALTYVWAPWYL